MKFNATFGPALLFLCCFLNGCLAHNIYLTYYYFKKSFVKRIRTYRIIALLFAALIYLITLTNLDFLNFHLFNPEKNVVPIKISIFENNFVNQKPINLTNYNNSNNNSNDFSDAQENLTENFLCFNSSFIFTFYALIFCILCYISHHLYYIINRKNDFISFSQGKINYKIFKNLNIFP